jgi:imidazolonepropionase-like amidohydrolase
MFPERIPELMMKRLLCLVLLLTGCTPVLAGSIVLNCDQLLDVEAGRMLGQRSVLIEDNRISMVGKAADIAKVMDGEPPDESHDLGTCLPGLMDMHTHLNGQLSRNGYIKRFVQNEADFALAAAHYAAITLNAGFTTVRNLGDSYNVTVALRDAIAQGLVPGPRIFTAAKSLATTGGHADPTNGYASKLAGDPGPAEGVVNSVGDARKAVRQRYKDGADLIKITATGGVLSLAKNGQNPQFTAEELAAIIRTANDYGMHVAAHAHGAEGMKRAVLAGVTSIEHGTFMTDEVMELMKEHGTYYVPTILAGNFVAEKAQEEGYFPEVVRPKAAEVGPQITDTFARAYRAGVKIAFGTDSGVSAHGDNAQEFALMVAAGMPPIEAIQSATLVSAALLGQQDSLGQIKVGMLADIVAVDGDPLKDISVLETIGFVMKDGAVIKP